MRQFIEYITSMFPEGGIVINDGVAIPINFLLLLGLAAIVHLVARWVVLPVVKSLLKKSRTRVDDAFERRCLFRRVVHLLPATVISAGLPIVLPEESELYVLLSKALSLYYILIGLAIFDSILSAFRDLSETNEKASQKVGLTGALQALKIMSLILAVILAISVLAGKSPIYFISGLGAFTAILMLIFKDPILGLVAGVQLSAMDLVRKGDWIDIPKHGADGAVVDITLTTVKVRNWDMTFTAVPAYELVASSFKNWRGMFESGGRRIKRSLRFSSRSIRFLTDEELDNLRKIKLIAPYIDGKIAEICDFNATTFSSADLVMQANGRRLTNIGTYRAYCDLYLRNHPGINKDLIIMVRQLQPTELGLPLEIYAFTSDVKWVGHENTQSDIFDHLLSIVSEFGLEIYQR